MSDYYYQSHELWRIGKIDGRYETDCIAKRILKGDLDPFENVTPSKRKDYWTPTHVRPRDVPKFEGDCGEEIEGIIIFNQFKDCVLDYQVPLMEHKDEYDPGDKPKGRGNIDLLLKLDGVLYLTELKWKICPKESLLRAVLEIETYYRMVNEKLLKTQYGCDGLPLKKAILLHESDGCRPYQEWLKKEDYSHVHQLMSDWDIHMLTVEGLEERFGKLSCK